MWYQFLAQSLNFSKRPRIKSATSTVNSKRQHLIVATAVGEKHATTAFGMSYKIQLVC